MLWWRAELRLTITEPRTGRKEAVVKLPISTTSMTFLSAGTPEPVVDFETKRPRTDEAGQPLFAAQIVVLADGGAEVISVKTAGTPPSIGQGQAVKVTGLVATPWAMGDRSGVSFRAASIEATATVSAGSGRQSG